MNDTHEDEPRQQVEKTGRRRAKLTAVAGTDLSPESPVDAQRPATASDPREAEMLRDKPPHWS